MTKEQLILKFYDGKRSDAKVAALAGCSRSYVRVVARQYSRPGRKSEIKEADALQRAQRYAEDVRFRKREQARCRAYQHAKSEARHAQS